MQFRVPGTCYNRLVSWGYFLTEDHSFGDRFTVVHHRDKDISDKRRHYVLTLFNCSNAAITWMQKRVDTSIPAGNEQIDRWCRATYNRNVSIYSIITNPDDPDYKTGCYGKAMQIYERLQLNPNNTLLILKQDGVIIDTYRQNPRRVTSSEALGKYF